MSDEILSGLARNVNRFVEESRNHGLYKLRLTTGLVLDWNRSRSFCEGFARNWNENCLPGESLVEIVPQNEIRSPTVN